MNKLSTSDTISCCTASDQPLSLGHSSSMQSFSPKPASYDPHCSFFYRCSIRTSTPRYCRKFMLSTPSTARRCKSSILNKAVEYCLSLGLKGARVAITTALIGQIDQSILTRWTGALLLGLRRATWFSCVTRSCSSATHRKLPSHIMRALSRGPATRSFQTGRKPPRPSGSGRSGTAKANPSRLHTRTELLSEITSRPIAATIAVMFTGTK